MPLTLDEIKDAGKLTPNETETAKNPSEGKAWNIEPPLRVKVWIVAPHGLHVGEIVQASVLFERNDSQLHTLRVDKNKLWYAIGYFELAP